MATARADGGTTLFVYGTLQHPPLLDRLLGRVPSLRPATLAGHRAARLAGRAYPGLVVEAAASAPGAVLAVTRDELEVLDVFEGDQYERVVVTASTADGPVEAHAWRLRTRHADLALDDDWSLADFLAHDVAAFLGGSRRGGRHPGST